AILQACGREMGVPDGMWYPGMPCSMDSWITCDPFGSVNAILPHDQGLNGSFCSNISLLTSLTKIDLANNSLSGSLPTSLGNLTRLDTIVLGYNNLSGVIPPTLGNLMKLTTL
ncbi:unnamed protein product, partial [Closterium sp. Yama58-4]